MTGTRCTCSDEDHHILCRGIDTLLDDRPRTFSEGGGSQGKGIIFAVGIGVAMRLKSQQSALMKEKRRHLQWPDIFEHIAFDKSQSSPRGDIIGIDG